MCGSRSLRTAASLARQPLDQLSRTGAATICITSVHAISYNPMRGSFISPHATTRRGWKSRQSFPRAEELGDVRCVRAMH